MDRERLRKLKSEIVSSIGSGYTSFWSPKEGETYKVRILPSIGKDANNFYRDILQHARVGPENKYVTCRKTDGHTDCPLCAKWAKDSKASDSDIRKKAKDYRPSQRYMIAILVRDDEDDYTGPFLWSCPKTAFNDILSYLLDEEYGNCIDPIEGRDFTIERDDSSNFTKYHVRARPKQNPLSVDEEEFEAFMTNIPDVSKAYKMYSVENILRICEGMDPVEEEDTSDTDEEEVSQEDTKEDKPATSKKGSKGKKSSKKGEKEEKEEEKEEKEEEMEEKEEKEEAETTESADDYKEKLKQRLAGLREKIDNSEQSK